MKVRGAKETRGMPSSELKPSLDISIDPPLPLRIDPSRHIESNQPIHDGRSRADARHRDSNPAPVAPVAGPSEVGEDDGTDDADAMRGFHAGEPEGVAGLTGLDAGTLAAHGLRAAEIPEALRGEKSDRAACRDGECGGSVANAVRCGDVERGATVCTRVSVRTFETEVGEEPEALWIEPVGARVSRSRAQIRASHRLEVGLEGGPVHEARERQRRALPCRCLLLREQRPGERAGAWRIRRGAELQ